MGKRKRDCKYSRPVVIPPGPSGVDVDWSKRRGTGQRRSDGIRTSDEQLKKIWDSDMHFERIRTQVTLSEKN